MKNFTRNSGLSSSSIALENRHHVTAQKFLVDLAGPTVPIYEIIRNLPKKFTESDKKLIFVILYRNNSKLT